jgi:hypothetical protein
MSSADHSVRFITTVSLSAAVTLSALSNVQAGPPDFLPKACYSKAEKKWFLGNSVCAPTAAARFDHPSAFWKSELSEMQVGRKYGVINTSGEFVVPPIYDQVVWRAGDEMIRVSELVTGCRAIYKVGYYDLLGKLAIPSIYSGNGDFRHGLAPTRTLSGDEHCPVESLLGYIDVHGAFAIPPRFEDGGDFEANGLAPVKVGGKWGFIDTRGEMIIRPQFDELSVRDPGFDTYGYARVKTGDGWHLVDASGHIFGPPHLGVISPFSSEGIARVVGPGDFGREKTGLIDRHGDYVLRPSFDTIREFVNGFAQARRGSKWGFIDTRGNVVVDFRYEDHTEDFKNGVAKGNLGLFDTQSFVTMNFHYDYLNTRGKVIIPYGKYDRVGDFDAFGMSLVVKGNKYALVNTEGAIVSAWYDAGFGSSGNGLYPVRLDEKFGYIDTTGKVIVPFAYEDAREFDAGGLARAKSASRWGVIDTSGHFIVQPRFDQVWPFDAAGFAVVMSAGKFGFVDRTGAMLVEPVFEKASPFDFQGFADVTFDGKHGYIDKRGTFVPLPE